MIKTYEQGKMFIIWIGVFKSYWQNKKVESMHPMICHLGLGNQTIKHKM